MENARFSPRGLDSDVQLSKRLSWLLRHGASSEGLPIKADGYISAAAICSHPRYSRDYTLEVLQRLVAGDRKCRYSLRHNTFNGAYEIRANQGHSLDTVQSEKCLERILKPEDVPVAVHGTYKRHWPSIRVEGLKRMGRLHVHFATYDDESKAQRTHQNVDVSGFRADSQLLIYLNVPKAMERGGMQLYRSVNNVILCEGLDGSGCIPKEYFAKVVDRRTHKLLDI